MTPSPSPLDLSTLAACKQWAGISGSASDANIQACLTAFSVQFLRMTGRGMANGAIPAASPFNQSVVFQEIYDAIPGERLYLRNFPITSVQSLSAGGVAIAAGDPASNAFAGYAIDNSGRCLLFPSRGYGPLSRSYYSGGRGCGTRWTGGGAGSIAVTYTAGFAAQVISNELQTIVPGWLPLTDYGTGDILSDGINLQRAATSGRSASTAPAWAFTSDATVTDGGTLTWVYAGSAGAPNTVVVNSLSAVLSDQGVLFFSNGVALTPSLTAPSAGQYFLVAPGVYRFNPADAGKEVQISYTAAGTPADIAMMAQRMVTLNYKRRDWVGILSIAMKDVGSTTYSTFALSPDDRDVVRYYRRMSYSG